MKTNFIESVRTQFPVLKTGVIYLDSAATSLKPKATIDALNNYYSNYSFSSHNNAVSIINQKIDQTRSNMADYLNVSEKEIVFTSGATEGLNIIANGLTKNLKPKDEIILNKLEHASNVLPWIKYAKENDLVIKWATVNKEFKIDAQSILDQINKKTKIVSFASTFNTTGTTNDLQQIIKKIKAFDSNIIVVIDYTQTIAYHRFDFKALDLDFAVFSSHKFFGPTGLGVLFGKNALLTKMEPLLYGGGMNRTYNEEAIAFKESPDKFEAGTPHIGGIIAFNEAINFAREHLSVKSLEHLSSLKSYLVAKLNEITLFDLDVIATEEAAHTVLFNIREISSEDLAVHFYKHNIIVRGGSSCSKMMAQTYLNQNNFVRVSFQIYNTFKEIDKFVEVLKAFSNPIDTLFKLDPTIC